jgi:cysteine desulfurase/selenocysteine lyase
MRDGAARAIDVDRARLETPGCAGVLHLNNAGASLQPAPVIAAVHGYLEREIAIGGYEAERDAEAELAHVYEAAASLLGGAPDEIAVLESASRAWAMAFYAIPFRRGDRILTAVAEYASNYIAYLQVAKRIGVSVEVVPNDDSGALSTDALAAMMDDRVKLVSVTHMPTNGGLVNPAEAIGRITRDHDCLYLLDACQTVGQMPVDVGAIGCDLLTTTGRKYLRGPRGVGLLWVRRELIGRLEPTMLDLHSATWSDRDGFTIRADARRFEMWEANYAAKVGLGAALDYAASWTPEAIWERVRALADRLRAGLTRIGATIMDTGNVRGGIVTFTLEGVEPAALRDAMTPLGVNIWTSSRPHTRIDMEDRGLTEIVRASVHYYNTEAEIDRFCELVAETAPLLRSLGNAPRRSPSGGL